MSKSSMFLVFLIVPLLFIPATLGQSTSGQVFGTVQDATGAVIPGADVVATNPDTGLSRSTISNDVGFYEFPSLVPGRYTVAGEMAGFKKYEQTDVVVTIGSRVRVDLSLQIGELTEMVTVSGGTVMVDTRSAELSAVVDDKRITDLPLGNRNVVSLAALLPGVSIVRASTVQTSSRGGPTLNVNGGRRNSNYLVLNGTYFMNPSRNTGMNPPPPDAIREFRIKTNNFSAAEGRNSGSVVSFATRSGTNDFHGSAWWFHRNDNLNARDWDQASKGEFKQNQYGVAAGGPVVKDKIFVFGSYEGFRDRPSASATSSFPPTAAERAGDFSHVEEQLVNPFTGEEYLNNQIPTSDFDSVSQGLLGFLPLPNQPDGSYQENVPAHTNNNMFMFRNDINLADNQDIFWHYYYNDAIRPDRLSGNIPGWQTWQDQTKTHNFGATHNWTLSPTLLNSFTFGYMRTPQLVENIERRTNAELGLDMPDYTDYGSTRFSPSGRFSLNSQSQFDNRSTAYTFHESMSMSKGNHTFKFGAEFFRLTFFQAWLSPPSFSFNGTQSGDTMADFMLGAYRNVSIGYGRRNNDTIQPWYWSFYFQDEWRVSPQLTLTLGMRYELPSPWNDKREIALTSMVLPWADCQEDPNTVGNPKDLVACGAQTTSSGLDAPPGYLFANADLPRGLIEADKNNFAPRLGFAYDLCGDGITSIRGGAGIFYDTANADTLAQVNPPFSNSATFPFDVGPMGSTNIGQTRQLPPPNPSPEQGGFTTPLNPLSTDLSTRNTYFYHWNLGVQRQVTRDLMVAVDYVGKIGRKGLAFYPVNPAYYIPGQSTSGNWDDRVRYGRGIYGSYYNLMLGSMFDTWYHGMNVEVNKRLSDGFSFLQAFTWSKSIDQNSTYTLGGDAPNPFDIKKSEQGLAEADRRIVVATSVLWEPFVSSDNALLRGWTFTPIFRATTGSPLEFYNGDDVALNGVGFGQHPIALQNPGKSHDSRESAVSEYFNTSALVWPEEGSYGNAAKGLIAGPGYWTFDLGILRDFYVPMTEDSRFQIRAEFFNLFNNVNLGNPTTTVTSSTFGRIRSAGGARQIQLGLKFIW